MSQQSEKRVEDLDVPLERDGFLRDVLRHLSGALQEVIGLEESSGFISLVGQKIGDDLNRHYRRAFGLPRLNREQVAAVLVDLKRRIQGQFEVVSQDDGKIVLHASACPFGDKVLGRSSLCMMTSSVFGTLVADNLGYAKVALEETIARGAPGCRIVVYLAESDASVLDAASAAGVEYFKG